MAIFNLAELCLDIAIAYGALIYLALFLVVTAT
jgi:hypothetical protein